MTREKNVSRSNQQTAAESNLRDVVIAEVASEDVQETTDVKVSAMNISATLLHLDNGDPFPPRATLELTQAEVDRFSKLNLISIKS
jgi:hypothetical protein